MDNSQNISEATVGDYVEKIKKFDVDRFNSGKSPYPTTLEKVKEFIHTNPRDYSPTTQHAIAAGTLAAGTAATLGVGYGAYKYIKNRKNRKKSKE